MIVVKIELHSAITHKVTEIGRMYLANVGGTAKRGDYEVAVMRKDGIQRVAGENWGSLRGRALRAVEVLNYPRQSLNVWNLAARALKAAGFK